MHPRDAPDASRRHRPAQRAIAVVSLTVVGTAQDSGNGTLSGEAAECYHGTLCDADSVVQWGRLQECTCLALGLLRPWHFNILDMHDDAVVAWDWWERQNVGEGQQWLVRRRLQQAVSTAMQSRGDKMMTSLPRMLQKQGRSIPVQIED